MDDLTLRILDRMVKGLSDDNALPTFRGHPITDFDYDDLVKICKLFANEWKKAQEDCYRALKKIF